MRFTRRKGSKRLQFRGRGGRYERASLDKLGVVTCDHCQRFYEGSKLVEDEHGFVEKVRVPACPHCGHTA